MCSDKTLASKELFDFDSAVLTLCEALIDFLSFHFTDDDNFCYWYRTKVRTTFASLSVGFAQIVFPPLPPISMLFVFESHALGHFPDRSSHQQTRGLHNIEIGGRGETVHSFCFLRFDTCLSFVSLFGVVRTFVRYLSGLKICFVCWCHFTMFCYGHVSALWAFCNYCTSPSHVCLHLWQFCTRFIFIFLILFRRSQLCKIGFC